MKSISAPQSGESSQSSHAYARGRAHAREDRAISIGELVYRSANASGAVMHKSAAVGQRQTHECAHAAAWPLIMMRLALS
jgi:hypothetical protein